MPDDHAVERLIEGFNTSGAAEVLQTAMQRVVGQSSHFVVLRDQILPVVNRQPLGDDLR